MNQNKDNNMIETAILAGGCFWGMEELLRKIPGVTETRVGYTGGSTQNPNYEIVKTGSSGHAEAVEIKFDPTKLTFEKLLEYFYRMHDPTTLNQQGNDIGTQYRSAIFYTNEKQKEIAEKSLIDFQKFFKNKITTQVLPAGSFYLAEEYHQDYLQKHPTGYTCHYLRELKKDQ